MADRLYRSRTERVIGGVAGGMAENLDLDPTIVRLGWVVLALLAPIIPLVYFALMFVIPEEPEAPVTGSHVRAASEPRPPAATAEPNVLTEPSVSAPSNMADRAPRRAAGVGAASGTGGLVFGVLLVVVGGWFLVRQYLPRFDPAAYWPYLAIGLGVVLIAVALQRGRSRS